MTVPSMVVFAYDGRGVRGALDPKVMVRSLLFSTGAQGHAVETLFLRLWQDGSEYVFPVWGLATDKLERGGGLFVGKTGLTAWHHFVFSSGSGQEFEFGAGTYELQIWARTNDLNGTVKLWGTELNLAASASPTRHDGSEQVWFNRDPESGRFLARLESRSTLGSRMAEQDAGQ